MKLFKFFSFVLIFFLPNSLFPMKPKSLTETAALKIGNYALSLYNIWVPEGLAYRGSYEYLKKLPWDLQLQVFKALITSLQPIPAWIKSPDWTKIYESKTSTSPIPLILINSSIITNPESLTQDAKRRSSIVELLFYAMNYFHLWELKEQKKDLTNLIFKYQAYLFPGSTAFIDENWKVRTLLEYAPLQERLNALAFITIVTILKEKQSWFPKFLLTPVCKLIQWGLLDNTFVIERYPLIILIDHWLSTKTIDYLSIDPNSGVQILQQIPISEGILYELQRMKKYLLETYPKPLSCTIL